MKTILFVYGTLKRGMKYHWLLSDQAFLISARTMPCYRLLDLGNYPGLIADDEHGLAIHGELWEIDEPTLAQLDVFECVPSLFQRRHVDIDSFVGEAQAYFYVGSSKGTYCGNCWPPPRARQGDNASS
jgi:gamma-glutamylaminecyclotransferase